MKEINFNNLPQAVELILEKLENLEKRLLENPGNKSTEASDQFLTIEQAAEFLNLAKPTVYSMVSRGELPYMKRSKRLYFSKDDLQDYIRNGRVRTNDEVRQQAHLVLNGRRKEVCHV